MKTQNTIIILAAILFTYLVTNYLVGDKAEKLERRYRQEIEALEADYKIEMEAINRRKQKAYDSLLLIANQRKFTIEELKSKPNEANEKIRYIVRDYRNDELDSLIRVMFSDLSRFN